jgi:hypothetical protein
MVIVNLMGGLGNQMFQYAAAKALAEFHGTDLRVDDAFLKADSGGKYTQRKYELNVFNADIKVLSESERKGILTNLINPWYRRLNRYFPFLFTYRWYQEKSQIFDTDFFNLGKNIYLNGYWQSEKYFIRIREILLSQFEFKEEFLNYNLECYDKINSTNSVSVHIRRGDYVTLKEASDFHGVCSMHYYENAIRKIASLQPDSVAFIFSDDVAWCKSNIHFNIPVHFVESNSAYNDMFLMQHCKNNIIANSSFSWWSAWLNKNTEKVVIAPLQWFAKQNESSKDIVPQNWIRI